MSLDESCYNFNDEIQETNIPTMIVAFRISIKIYFAETKEIGLFAKYCRKKFKLFAIFLKSYSRGRIGLVRLQQWLCYLQGPGFEFRLRPVEFFACNKVSPLNNRIPICVMCPNYLARGYQVLLVKQANKLLYLMS